jgi:hypothetical protein
LIAAHAAAPSLWSLRFRTTRRNDKGDYAVRVGVVGFAGAAPMGCGSVMMVLKPKALL